ncbi:hypothetical protein HHI36_016327 [Cryptolaemus montrouzieri]|uniref:Uncharacterized protein n=1 Tax=Cryptolaemus montrouzieri TaxID=559131 RepID=A0ABD2NJW1_9CUCU
MYRDKKILLILVAILSQTFAKPCVKVKIENEEGDEGICCSLSRNADIEKLTKDEYTIIELDGSPYICYGYYELNESEIDKRDVRYVKLRQRRDAQRPSMTNGKFSIEHLGDPPHRCPDGYVRNIAGKCTRRF